MRNRQHDGRLSLHPYWKALDGVKTQFALVRFILKEAPEELIQRFYNDRHHDQLAKIDNGILGSQDLPQEKAKLMRESLEYLREHVQKKHSKQNRPADNHFIIELSEDRLNQSELLLLVAHFESFMKEVHRTFLRAAPAIVFSKSDTKVELSELFDTQAGSLFDKFLNELIIKEVKRLDAQKIEQRAQYFADHFGVSFADPSEIEKLKDIMRTRNSISHEIYSAPPSTIEEIKEQPLVSDEMLGQAQSILRNVPANCIRAGARSKIYQAYFRY